MQLESCIKATPQAVRMVVRGAADEVGALFSRRTCTTADQGVKPPCI